MRCSGSCSIVSRRPARSTAPSIVVTADHGESLGDHGETTHGLFAYESTLAVPLIVSGASVGRGVVDAPVAHADILPTIVDLRRRRRRRRISTAGRPSHCLPATRPIYFEALEANLTRGWAPLTGVVVGRLEVHRPAAARALQPPRRSRRSAQPRRARDRRAATRCGARSRSSRRHGPAPPCPAAVDEDAAARLRSLGYTAASAAPARQQYSASRRSEAAGRAQRASSTRRSRRSTPGGPTRRCRGFLALLRERPDFLTARTSAATVLMATGARG